MEKFLLISAGGMIGALLRYGVSGLVHRFAEGVFPWGTLTVNLVGSFIIGIIWAIAERFTIPASFRLFVLVGVLGSFTTFSTYTLETVNLLRDGELKGAIVNMVLNNLLGLGLVVAGFVAALYITNTSMERW